MLLYLQKIVTLIAMEIDDMTVIVTAIVMMTLAVIVLIFNKVV